MEADISSNQRPVIQASEILAKIERGEDVEYDGVIVEGDLDISGLELPTERVYRTEDEEHRGLPDQVRMISSHIAITNSEIHGNVNFGNVQFQEQICFEGTEFSGYAVFEGVEFGNSALFSDARFSGYANFNGNQFGGYADFQETQFSKAALFSKVKFAGWADFSKVQFNGSIGIGALFAGSQFVDYITFKGAQFNGDTSFRRAKFDGWAVFEGSQFGGYADFKESHFDGYINLVYVQFHWNVSFKDTKFSDPKYQEVACRIAKRKMEDLGNKNDADYYFYKEMEAVRIQNGIKGTEKSSWPWDMRVSKWLKLVGSKIWRLGRYDLFEYVFIQGIFGYGVHPLRLFVFWILMAVAFASFYWYFDAVEDARTSVDYIWFSIATSATPGYALYNPIGNYKIVAGIQAIIGTFMWAAFIATFARKWQR